MIAPTPRLLRNLVLLATLGSLARCSSSGSGSSPPPSSDGGAGAPEGGAGLRLTIGPFDVAAGVEITQCIVVPLGNTDEMVLDGYQIDLYPGSHHLFAYFTSEAPHSNLVDCRPFAGLIAESDVPVAFAGKEHLTWSFPSGVAVDIPAAQNVKLEAHYINTTSATIQAQGTITLQATPKATHVAYDPAGFAFIGTVHIDIPPNAAYSTGPLFQRVPAGTQLVSITTHEHRLGTRAQVWASAQAGDLSTPIADDHDWSAPTWRTLSQPVDFDGTNGVTFQCDWTNTTDQPVTYGESALQEMCEVGGYFHPGHGIMFCFDGTCHQGGASDGGP
jgi:hypothetical protein